MKKKEQLRPEYSAAAARMMQLMGHTEGEALGKSAKGITAPLSAAGSAPGKRTGLGYHAARGREDVDGQRGGLGGGYVPPEAGSTGDGVGAGGVSGAARAGLGAGRSQQDYRIKGGAREGARGHEPVFRLGEVAVGEREVQVLYPGGREDRFAVEIPGTSVEDTR